MQAALEEQAHQQRFNRVVAMVAERQLVAAMLRRQLVERAAAHFRAERAGILLLPLFKDDLADIRFFDRQRHADLFAHFFNARRIERLKAHREHQPLELEILMRKEPVERERLQKQQAVLPARNADGHAVAGLEHIEIVIRAADAPKHFFHIASVKGFSIANHTTEKPRVQYPRGDFVAAPCSPRSLSGGFAPNGFLRRGGSGEKPAFSRKKVSPPPSPPPRSLSNLRRIISVFA